MKFIFSACLTAITFLAPISVQAQNEPPPEWLRTITFYHEIYEYKLPLAKYPEYFQQVSVDSIPIAADGLCYWNPQETEPEKNAAEKATDAHWELNKAELEQFFAEFINSQVEREPTDVRIYRDENGEIAFEGAANFGKKVDVPQAISLLETALNEGIERIELPVNLVQPEFIVEDDELRELGIKEIVSVGESDFTGSSLARMQNIEVGSDQFNGMLIKPGDVASFNDNLGAVTAAQGYLPELVIIGPKLEKEYGGGLCQVSSTAFRAALLAGLPIVERHPHSFAVSYYAPFGTDATIYPGHKDLRFSNDTQGAILVQTTMDRDNQKLRFHFYGSKDDRKVKVFGPEIGRHVGPLPARSEVSTNLAPGETQWLSKAVAGFDTIWRRVVIPPTTKTVEDVATPTPEVVAENTEADPRLVYEFFSRYQPRANWSVTGVASEPMAEGSSI